MSNNLANLMVGFGLDLSALQKDAPEAFRILNQQTLGMTAEMKRASREGSESFRLIDEALGIHVSRPLTRILTQEFPGFASALQSIMGAGIVGALGVAAYEGFEKLSRSIENARKAQEAFAQSSIKADETSETVIGDLEHKLADLQGDHTLKFKLQGADETKRAIDEIGKAFDKAAEDAEKASGFWSQLELDAVDFLKHSAEGLTHIGDWLGMGDVSKMLGTKNLHDSLFDSQQLVNMKAALKDMRTDLDLVLNADTHNGTHEALTVLQTDINAARAYLDDMRKASDKAGQALAQDALKFFTTSADAAGLSQQIADTEKINGLEDERKKAVKEAQQDLDIFFNDAANSSWKIWVKVNEELDKALAKMRESGDLQGTAQRYQGAKAMSFPGVNAVGPPPGAPQLSDQAELEKVTDDQNEAWNKAGQILQEIESPAQRYATELKSLKVLEDEGRLSAEQVAQATQNLGEQMTKAQLHVQQMEKELEKLLQHSTSATAGVQAFFLQLQIEAGQNGKAAFDILNSGLKGFEDQLTKAIFEGKAKWKDFFRSMTEEAFKLMLNKDIANLFKMVGNSSFGKNLGLDKLFNPSQTAQVAALSANTAAITANTSAQLAKGAVPGGGGVIGDMTDSGAGSTPDIPQNAAGTDDFAGGLSWVGEQGPELMNLPGGTSITPAGSMRSGGDTHIYRIDARGGEIGVEEKIVRALQAAEPRFIGKALTNFSEVQKRTPQGR
jgi:hypothetical protein